MSGVPRVASSSVGLTTARSVLLQQSFASHNAADANIRNAFFRNNSAKIDHAAVHAFQSKRLGRPRTCVHCNKVIWVRAGQDVVVLVAWAQRMWCVCQGLGGAMSICEKCVKCKGHSHTKCKTECAGELSCIEKKPLR